MTQDEKETHLIQMIAAAKKLGYTYVALLGDPAALGLEEVHSLIFSRDENNAMAVLNGEDELDLWVVKKDVVH